MKNPTAYQKPRQQAATLPVRRKDGVTEVLLITSRETGRWVIPKGWLQKAAAPRVVAEREAFEEAGLIGTASKQPVGSYHYAKRLSATKTVTCEVSVFLLDVTGQADDWPERTQRRQRWMAPEAASRLVAEAGLAALLRRIAAVAHDPGKLAAAVRAMAAPAHATSANDRRKDAAGREGRRSRGKRGKHAPKAGDRDAHEHCQRG